MAPTVPAKPGVNQWWLRGGGNTANNVRIGVSSPSALQASPAYNAVTSYFGRSSGPGVNNAAIQAASLGRNQGTGTALQATPRAPARNPNLGGSGSSGGGRGGGGAAPVPQFTQDQLNQMAALLRAGGPKAGAQLDLPDYQAYTPKAFDDSMYQQMRGQLGQAQATDVGTANKATQDYINFLTSNYQNAFTNPNNTYAQAGQAPGMDTMSMQRLLQAQGVDPSVMAGMMGERAGADQAMGNMWRSQAANEDVMQRNRIGAGQLTGNDAVNRINALAMGGQAGINQQQGAAKSSYDQRVEDWARQDQQAQQQIAQQEAMQNWEQGNTYNEQQQAYRNAALQALFGLMPDLKGSGLAMPDAASLGWA